MRSHFFDPVSLHVLQNRRSETGADGVVRHGLLQILIGDILEFLLLGAPAPQGGRYAMIKGQDVVFTLETSAADRLLRDLLLEQDSDQKVWVEQESKTTNHP